jgi:hypothetical protein
MTRRDDQVPVRQGLMLIQTKAVDGAGRITFEGQTEVDPVALMLMAESREDLALSKGRAYTEGAVPFLAAQLIEAARAGRGDDELRKAAIEVALVAWLADSIYGGVSAAEFMRSNLHFTMLPGGAVKYTRMRVA